MQRKPDSYLMILLIIFFLIANTVYFSNKSERYISNNDKKLQTSGPLTPNGIRLTASNELRSSMAISWYTESAASDPKVVYSNNSNLENNQTIAASVKIISGYYIYSVNIMNLASNKTYYYQVSSDSSNKREILNFTTAPERTSKTFKFMAYGDTRTQREQRTELAKKITTYFNDIDFYIHSGDIVENGLDQYQWNDYFTDVELLTKKIPGYFIEGNHENINGFMYDNILLPSNGLNSYYYSFKVGPLKFIGLNSYRDWAVQTPWLEQELNDSAHDNDTLWNFAFMHSPIFNSMASRPDLTELINSWCPLFETYNLDVVFAGHNHYYERSYPMNRNKEIDDWSLYNYTNPTNPIYYIAGSGGAPLYDRDENPIYSAHYNKTYHFIIGKVNVDDLKEETSLVLETWAMPDDYSNLFLIDNVTIVKKGALLKINNPLNNQLFGVNAPSFNITLDKRSLKSPWYTLNCSWYTLDSGKTNYTFTGNVGEIDAEAWYITFNGTVTIKFYANTSKGDLYYNEIIVRKDNIAPIITINSLSTNDLFGKKPPNYDLSMNEPHLDKVWYVLTNGNLNYTSFELSGTIDDSLWKEFPNGTITIRFYANDTVNNEDFAEITVRKDINAPTIQILRPTSYEFFTHSPPNFTLKVEDSNLNRMWYTILGTKTNFTTSETNGTIDRSAWDSYLEGLLTIRFYANDSVGNENFSEIIILKDIIAPRIIVNYPETEDIFENDAPSFIIRIQDLNLDTMWYTINDMSKKYFFTSNGTINQSVWASLGFGKVIIKFYANDSNGYVNYFSLTIDKSLLNENKIQYRKSEEAALSFELILIGISFLYISLCLSIVINVLRKNKYPKNRNENL